MHWILISLDSRPCQHASNVKWVKQQRSGPDFYYLFFFFFPSLILLCSVLAPDRAKPVCSL